MSATISMNHNSHYLKLLNIPVWQRRTNIVEEMVEIEQEPQVVPEVSFVQPEIQAQVVIQEAPQIHIPIANNIESCTACDLYQGRTQVITGEGTAQAKLFVVTEAPTFGEDLAGKPLVDDARKLFNNILKALGYSASDIYITPYVKCAPYQTFITQKEEMICSQHLQREIDQIQPEKILLLGRNVAKYLLNSQQAFDDLRQQQGMARIFDKNIPVYVSYNIYQLLKFPEDKAKVWKDMKRLMA